MAIFVFIVFYLPIILLPCLFLAWLFFTYKNPSPLKFAGGLVLLACAIAWYLAAGHEVISPAIKEKLSPKITVQFAQINPCPKLISFLIIYMEPFGEYSSSVKVNEYGFSDFHRPPGEIVQAHQFDFSEGPCRFLVSASSHFENKGVYVFLNQDVDSNSSLSRNLTFLNTDPQNMVRHSISKRSLEEIVLGLKDYESGNGSR